jgi:high affinity Mn2+ porin
MLVMTDTRVVAGPAGSPVANEGEATPSSGFFASDLFALHGQSTFVFQGHDGFHAPYGGAQSLQHDASGDETWDLTLFDGVHPWSGGEIWLNEEIDQGFGIGNTLGLAGFSSGEAYKVGRADPYFRLQRAFVRQTVNLGGAPDTQLPDLNQFGLKRSSDRLVLTAGKFAVTDIFDANRYAHDPRQDFLNWTLIDTGTFDYAADSWGYSVGAAGEWYTGRWTMRSGTFLMSNVPNSPDIDTSFHQFQTDGEIEERHSLFGQPGKFLLTAFLTHARMARFADAVTLADRTGQPADGAAVRRIGNRPGVSLSLEQQITPDIGAFARAGWADGKFETYEFTDVDRTLAAGISIGGRRWHRPNDTFGLGGAINVASRGRIAYLAAGGLGLLIGDGRLPDPGGEHIVETYYDADVVGPMHAALDYQWVGNPAYNRNRGPVSIAAVRVHVQM